jgi:hypothetical protein
MSAAPAHELARAREASALCIGQSKTLATMAQSTKKLSVSVLHDARWNLRPET